MADASHMPSRFWCAVGFGAAGSGVGSIVGMVLWDKWVPPLPEGVGTPHERLWNFYGGTHLGTVVGFAAGALVGVSYACWQRRRRRRIRNQRGTAGI